MCASSQGIKSQAWKALFCQDLVQNNTLSKTKTKKKRERERNHRHMKKHLIGLKLMLHMVESK